MNESVYQVITDRIVSLLEQGTIPWQKPWHGGEQAPQNLISRKHYRGVNVFLLNSMHYAAPFWLTYKQAQELGGHVRRLKNGNASTHPIHGPELRALRRLQRDYPDSPYVFTGERKGPLTPSSVRKIVARAGKAGGMPFPIHPHMFRHAAGYKLANDGQDTRSIQAYLGHRNITHTVRYTELSPDRFKNFWQD